MIKSIAEVMPFFIEQTKDTLLLIIDSYPVETHVLDNLFPAEGRKFIQTVNLPATSCAIPSLMTGLDPSEHGIIFKSIVYDNHIIKPLEEFKSIVEPRKFLPFPTFPETHEITYVAPHFFSKTDFFELTIRARNTKLIKVPKRLVSQLRKRNWDCFYEIESSCYKECLKKGKHMIFHSIILDKIFHEYGINTKKGKEALKFIKDNVSDIIEKKKVILISDHGHTEIKQTLELNKEDDKEFFNHIEHICLDRPNLMIFTKNQEFIEKYIKEKFGKKVEIFKKQQIIENEFFGRKTKTLENRLGDLIVATNGRHAFSCNEKSFNKKGMHGRINSKSERKIPLFTNF